MRLVPWILVGAILAAATDARTNSTPVASPESVTTTPTPTPTPTPTTSARSGLLVSTSTPPTTTPPTPTGATGLPTSGSTTPPATDEVVPTLSMPPSTGNNNQTRLETHTSAPEPTTPTTASPSPSPLPPTDNSPQNDSDATPTPSESEPRTPSPTTVNYIRQPTDFSSHNDESGLVIVGGREDRNTNTKNADPGIANQTRSSSLYHSLQYALGVVAAISLVLLLGAHSMAVDARFDWSSMACAPNTWEFVLYTSYIQHMMSLGQLVLIKMPYTLLSVVDGFSWSGFMPYHTDESAIHDKTNTSAGRRLDTIVLRGIVSFSDRIGVNEAELLVRTVTGLAIFAGGFLVLFFGVAAITKKKIEHHENHPSQRNPLDVQRILMWRDISMRVIGVLILLWVFSLYPLSVMSTYEMAMEIRADTLLVAPLTLAVIASCVVCIGGLSMVILTIRSKNAMDLSQPFHIAAWGCLYADYVHEKRLFLIAPVALQIISGVIVGSVTWDVLQLALLIGLHGVYLVAIAIVRPFTEGSVASWFATAIGVVKIVNLSVALVFVESSTWSTDAIVSAADVIVWLNAMLIFFWLLRHFGMIYQIVWCIRVGAARKCLDVNRTDFTLGTSVYLADQDATSVRSLGFSESWGLSSKERISIEDNETWRTFHQPRNFGGPRPLRINAL